MNCPQCQTDNEPGSAFCRGCGTSLVPAEPAGTTGLFTAAGYPPLPPRPAGPDPAHTSPAVSFSLGRLSLTEKVVAVASFVALISIWLPWFTASVSGYGSNSESAATAHGGWMYFEFLVAVLLIVYLAARATWDFVPPAFSHELLLITGTGVQLVIMLIAFADIPSVPSGLGVTGISVGWDFGAFIGLLAALAAAGPVIYPAIRSYLEVRKTAPPAA